MPTVTPAHPDLWRRRRSATRVRPAAGPSLSTSLWNRLSPITLALVTAAWAADPAAQEYNRAWVHFDSRHYAAARSAAAELIRTNPNYYRAYSLLARAAAADGIDISGTPELRSASAELREYALGVWLQKRQHYRSAVQRYTACIRTAPHFHPCYAALALLGPFPGAESLPTVEPPKAAPPVLAAVFRAAPLLRERRFDEAHRILMAAASAAPPPDQECERVVSLAFAGVAGGPEDKWREALGHVNRAAELGSADGIHEEWLSIHHLRSAYARKAGDHDLALAILTELEATARARQWKGTLPAVLQSRARDALDRGNPDYAIRAFTEARSQLLALPGGTEDEWVVAFEDGLASAFRTMGESESARFWYEQMLASARRFGNQFYIGFALRGLAGIAEQRGDPFAALQAESESVRTFSANGFAWQAGAGRGNLCEQFARLGDYRSANRECAAAYASALRFQDKGQVQSLLARRAALATEAGRPLEAIPMLMKSLAIGKNTNLPSFDIGAYRSLSEANRRAGKVAASLEYAKTALAIAERLKLAGDTNESLIELGNSYLASNLPVQAAPLFSRVLHSGLRAGNDHDVTEARRGLARVALRSSDRQTALRSFEEAVQTLESIRSRVLDPEMKTGFTQRNATLYEEVIQLLGDMERSSPGQGYGRRALELAERSRARVFLDMLAESRADLSRTLEPADRARRSALLRALSSAYKDSQRHPCAAHDAAVSRLEAGLNEWSRSIRATNPRFANVTSPDPLTVASIEKLAARERVTVVEFALGDHSSQLWIVDSKGLSTARLPSRRAIEAAVKSVRRQWSRPPAGAKALQAGVEASSRLFRMLFGAVPAQRLKGRLIIVPDGMLYYLPFEALVLKEDVRDPVYLNDVATITYAPSVTVFDELTRDLRRSSQPDDRLLAFGAPSHVGYRAGASAAAVRSAYTRAGLSLAPLPSAGLELEVLRGLFATSATIVRGAAATEQAFKSESLPHYRRIHFASHAILDASHPQRSGVVLSEGPADSGEDGILRVNEIVMLKLQADLVVLSACQTALGKIVRGEGVVGLTRALIYAGARNVAASLWPVNDVSSAEFMRLFYSRLRSGTPAPDALRDARRSLANSFGPAYRHPYFWAPFILIGER